MASGALSTTLAREDERYFGSNLGRPNFPLRRFNQDRAGTGKLHRATPTATKSTESTYAALLQCHRIPFSSLLSSGEAKQAETGNHHDGGNDEQVSTLTTGLRSFSLRGQDGPPKKRSKASSRIHHSCNWLRSIRPLAPRRIHRLGAMPLFLRTLAYAEVNNMPAIASIAMNRQELLKVTLVRFFG